MQTNHQFRVGLYSALCLSSLGLWLGEDSPLPYPLLVILCAVAAYAFTDHWGMLVVPGPLAPWLGAASLAFFVREEFANGNYQYDPVLPLGHLIIFFQVILLFHQKKPVTYWLLLLMSFLLMLIAALHNNRLFFGVLLAVFLVLTTWCLTQFLLLRESARHNDGCKPAHRSPMAAFLLLRESARHNELPDRRTVRPALRKAVTGSITSSLVIFSVGFLLFLIIPRQGQTAWTQYQFRPGQHLSGFDERIRLGQLGTILESDEEVMVIHMFDENGQPYMPKEEPYWRGIALTRYQGGRWERSVEVETFTFDRPVSRPDRFVRQEIRMQAVHRDVLFGLRPMFHAYTRTGEPLALIRKDGTLIRPENVPLGPLQYTVESDLDSSVPQIGEYPVRRISGRFRGELTEVPENLRDRLRDYVAQFNLPSNDDLGLCRFLMAHLQDPNEFDYTLRNESTDPTMDPVLDFLVNRKEGHCEYFASALALMLRAHDVPARVVNGFKGGDSSELLGKSIVVRQKHAHSWVEALIQLPGRAEPDWITLDPTPGQSRQRIVALVNPTPTLLRQVRDLSRQLWSNYVLNFNSSEQEAVVYAPIRQLATTQFQNVVKTAQHLWATRPQRFNWLAAFQTSAFMAGFLLLVRLLARLIASPAILWPDNGRASRGKFLFQIVRWMRKLLARWALVEATPRPRIAFYDQLLRLLETRGLSKPPSSTPHQFAEHASLELARSPQAATVARIPAELIDRYYRVRFGHENLNSPETEEIGRLLNKLAVALTRKE